MARAQSGLEPEGLATQPTPAPDATDYGWQVLLADGLSLAAAVTIGLGSARDAFDGPPSRAGATAASFWALSSVAGPAVHFANRRRWGWPSLALRLLVPPMTSAIGAFGTCMASIETTEHGSQGFAQGCEDPGLIAGMMVGTAGVALADAFLVGAIYQPEPPASQRWYGWQMLAVDAAALGVGLGYALSEPVNEKGEPLEPSLALSSRAYVVSALAAPLVHAAHGRGWRVLGGYALRLFVPPLMMLPGLVGYCAATGGAGSGSCARTGAGVGWTSGLLIVGVIDAFVFGFEDAPLNESAEPGMAWFPKLEVGRGGATVGLGAAF